MTDDYVSFETAKLLKEAGFDWPCREHYAHNKGKVLTWTDMEPCNQNEYKYYYSRPTLSLAAKWLREKFNVHFEIFVNNIDGWSYVAYNICEKTWEYVAVHQGSYEDALESGMIRVLKMICKNEKENSKQH